MKRRDVVQGSAVDRSYIVTWDKTRRNSAELGGDQRTDIAKRGPTDIAKRQLGIRIQLVIYVSISRLYHLVKSLTFPPQAPKGWHLFGTCLNGKPLPATPPKSTVTPNPTTPEPVTTPNPSTTPASPPATQPKSSAPPTDTTGPVSCRATGDGLRHRRCPNTSSDCPAFGQYPIGTMIPFVCKTTGESIEGDRYKPYPKPLPSLPP